MARVKRGVAAHARHKKVLKLAKGYRGRAKVAFRVGIEKVEQGLQYAYRDRRNSAGRIHNPRRPVRKDPPTPPDGARPAAAAPRRGTWRAPPRPTGDGAASPS